MIRLLGIRLKEVCENFWESENDDLEFWGECVTIPLDADTVFRLMNTLSVPEGTLLGTRWVTF